MILQQFEKYKEKSYGVAEKFKAENIEKYKKLSDCGVFLLFDIFQNIESGNQSFKLKKAFCCKDRFCYFCNWRKNLKYSKIIFDNIDKEKKYAFLTLTIKNCKIEDTKATIAKMQKAYKRMFESANIKKAFVGYLKTLEITISKTGEVHPHFHSIIQTSEDYFKNDYLDIFQIVQIWKHYLKIEYDPICDIRQVKNVQDSIKELIKYNIKSIEIEKLSGKNLCLLDKQLKSIRFFSSGGTLKGVSKELEDEELGVDTNLSDTGVILQEEDILYIYSFLQKKYSRIFENDDKIQENIRAYSKFQNPDIQPILKELKKKQKVHNDGSF